jgi:hypothetical protein
MPLRFAIVDRVSEGWSAGLGWVVVCQHETGTGMRRSTYIISGQSTTEWPVGVEQDAMPVTRREALTNTR